MKAWYARVSADRHRLFAGRHYRDVSVDHGEVVVTTRRGTVVLRAPADSLELVRVRNGLLLQVLTRDAGADTHVFEFRPRQHAAGRAFADTLR